MGVKEFLMIFEQNMNMAEQMVELQNIQFNKKRLTDSAIGARINPQT
ncbi:MAG: hypothetical protein Q4E86_12950 [Lachnospiraceae bacterium]|nr:hypothetical protein [Lachnospiraceae bacterium]